VRLRGDTRWRRGFWVVELSINEREWCCHPLLVITIIIMEMSQQAPAAPHLTRFPAPVSGAWHLGLSVHSDPGICRGEQGWGGREITWRAQSTCRSEQADLVLPPTASPVAWEL
jgi:hypothetical protein